MATAVVHLATRDLRAHIEVEDNPRGIVFAHDGTKAYVHNSLARTVSVIDTAVWLAERKDDQAQLQISVAHQTIEALRQISLPLQDLR